MSIFSGSSTGNFDLGIGYALSFSSYAIGIGQPQYLCLDTPQSLSLKLICFLPNYLSSKILIVSRTDFSGASKPLRKSEFIITPGPG